MGIVVNRLRVLACLFALLMALPVSAQAAPRAQREHYDAELVAESTSPGGGGKLTMAIHITPRPGWHIYWANPGESGYAPTVAWTMPQGLAAGELRHPAPIRLNAAGLVSYVHEGDTVLLQDITVPSGLSKGTGVPLKADIDLLICSEGTCVPDPVTLDTMVAIGNGAPDAAFAGLFSRARSALPDPLEAKGAFVSEPGVLKLFLPGLTYMPGDKADLFVEQADVAKASGAVTLAQADGGVIATVASGATAPNGTLSGVLALGGNAYAFSASKTATLPGDGQAKSGFDTAFLIAFATAILGGLLLNLMPCVFPILSLKALALVKYGESEKQARVEALGYTLGTVGTIVALGIVLLMLRSGGSAAGWAFQLQNPAVVGGLLLLVVAIATNMSGLYELPSLSVNGGQSDGFVGSMGTGALAAFIATPCTGPFMAGALGAALVMPPIAALAVMAGLGIGMALPFFCLGFFKPMRKWLPRPGNWMITLRRVLSIPMYATALGLAWIVGRQGGVSAMTISLAASVLLGLGLWWYGLRQHGGKRGTPAFAVALASFALVAFGVTPQIAAAEGSMQADVLGSRPFSESALADLTARKKPVFVYFTADWCLTCKVNEASSLSSRQVATAFQAGGITVLRGDWTRQDPAISAFLKAHHRAGVPLYLFYGPDGTEQELPQMLTPSTLLALSRPA